MRQALLYCMVFLLVLSIVAIAAGFFLLNAALPVINKGLTVALQTMVLEGFIVLVAFLFLAIILVCSTDLGSGPGGLLLVYNLLMLFEILKDVLGCSP